MRTLRRPRVPTTRLDPAEAFRRARDLDRMLAPRVTPARRGLLRGSHAVLNADQDARGAQAARRVDAARRPFARD